MEYHSEHALRKEGRCPSRREATVVLVLFALFFWVTGVFVTLRADHFLLAAVFLGLFFASNPTRKLAVALVPFLIFAVSYDWMRIWPNYMVSDIDVRGLYEAERACFGITAGNGVRVTLCDFFAAHHCTVADFFAGVFYLCWVPLPIAFGLYLYVRGERRGYLHFALVFLLVNLIGFAGYYVHPAAPPWYVLQYGFDPVLGTPGNVAGLGRFDELLGVPVFHSIYGRNANVFAAVPSLHAAYMLVALIYAIRTRRNRWVKLAFSIVMVGIWWTAVYSGHHYLIDVLLGIACALAGFLLFEFGLMRWPAFRRFMERYEHYIAR